MSSVSHAFNDCENPGNPVTDEIAALKAALDLACATRDQAVHACIKISEERDKLSIKLSELRNAQHLYDAAMRQAEDHTSSLIYLLADPHTYIVITSYPRFKAFNGTE